MPRTCLDFLSAAWRPRIGHHSATDLAIVSVAIATVEMKALFELRALSFSPFERIGRFRTPRLTPISGVRLPAGGAIAHVLL